MPYTTSSPTVFPQRNCSRLFSSEVRFYTENGHFAFLSPLLGLGATYVDRLRLIGKRVVDSLLVLIELFTALHGMQSRSSDEHSVRLSVRLSVCHTREL